MIGTAINLTVPVPEKEHRPTLECLDCDWEATVGTEEPPVEASQAAIDHHLIFGHRIERSDMKEASLRDLPL